MVMVVMMIIVSAVFCGTTTGTAAVAAAATADSGGIEGESRDNGGDGDGTHLCGVRLGVEGASGGAIALGEGGNGDLCAGGSCRPWGPFGDAVLDKVVVFALECDRSAHQVFLRLDMTLSLHQRKHFIASNYTKNVKKPLKLFVLLFFVRLLASQLNSCSQ